MDWDLWGPSYDLVAEESRQFECQCDFYFGYGFDVIEEDALNEKYCLQVLRILITKADTEIDELEQDLVSLQSELTWIENDEWSEMCGNILREKINSLEISIRTLRNKDKNNMHFHLLMQGKPIETLHEVLKALLGNNVNKNEEQSKDVKNAIALLLSSDTIRHSTDGLVENKRLSNSNSEIISRNIKESAITLTECGATLNQTLKLQEKKHNILEAVKPASSNLKDSSLQYLKLTTGHSDQKKLSSNERGSDGDHGLTLKDKRMIHNSPSKTADKATDIVEIVEVQAADALVTIADATNHATSHCTKKKKLSLDSDIVSEDIEEHGSMPSIDGVVLCSSLKSVVKKPDDGEKHVNSLFIDLCSDASRHASGHSDKIKKLSKSDLKVNGKGELREPSCCEIFSSSPCSEDKGFCLRTDKPGDAIARSVIPEALKCSTGLKPRKDESFSGVDTFENAKMSNLDVEQKLCNLALKSTSRQTMKDSRTILIDGVSLNSSLKSLGKRKDPLQILKFREASFIDTENCALTSLLWQDDQKGRNAVKLQLKEEELTMPEKAQIAVDEKNSNLNLSLNLPKEKAKKSMELSSISKSRKPKRPGSYEQNANLNQSLVGKTTKKGVDPGKFKQNGTALIDKPNSVSPSQKKRKRSADFPRTPATTDSTIQMDLSNLQGDMVERESKDDISVTEPHDSSLEAVASLPPLIELEKLKLSDLRAIAKRQKLTKFHKLRKDVLVELLVNQATNC